MGYRIFRGFCFGVAAVILMLSTRGLLVRLAVVFGWGGPAYDAAAELLSILFGCWVVWRYGDVVWPLRSGQADRPGRPRRKGRL